MSIDTLFNAIVLGIIEGATEYIPVSSTGHLIIFSELLGFKGPPGQVFEVFIQFGAVLAVCVLYARKLLGVLFGLASDANARRFARAIILAFIPAAVVGAIFHDYIKAVLFSPYVVCVALILGGVAILLIERFKHTARITNIDDFPVGLSLGIGLIQCVAMIPGVSRSAATILGALVLGVDRKTAAEFSFFLAVPTLSGAAVFDLWKNRAGITADGEVLLAVGFVTAFVSAMIVISWFIGFVSRRGFSPFAWYRIALGTILLVVLGF